MGFSERKHRAALEAPACAIHKIFVGQPADIGWLAGAGADLAGSLVVEPSEAAGDSNSGGVKAGVARTCERSAGGPDCSGGCIECRLSDRTESGQPGEQEDSKSMGEAQQSVTHLHSEDCRYAKVDE